MPARTAWKTSLVFTTRNIPGSLFRALSAFALRDLNLTKIESRPLRGKPWEYLFYLDFLGHVDETNVRNALSHLRELADYMRVLGCYPKGPSPPLRWRRAGSHPRCGLPAGREYTVGSLCR